MKPIFISTKRRCYFMLLENSQTVPATMEGKEHISFNPYKENTCFFIEKPDTGKSASYLKLQEYYLKECELIESSPIQFYR